MILNRKRVSSNNLALKLNSCLPVTVLNYGSGIKFILPAPKKYIGIRENLNFLFCFLGSILFDLKVLTEFPRHQVYNT